MEVVEEEEEEEEDKKMMQRAQSECCGSADDHYLEVDRRKAPNAPPPERQRCPRCGSMNTKFCYYNNYSTYQPRYFCKNCKRYWTKGGALRNVPFGGGCRKSKRQRKTQASYTHMTISTQEADTSTPPPLPPAIDNGHGQRLQHQLLFNNKDSIGTSTTTIGATNHPSNLHGLGGTSYEGGGFYGSTHAQIHQLYHGIMTGSEQLHDLRQHLPPMLLFHGNGHTKLQAAAGGLDPAPLLLPAMMGATSPTTSRFGWQQSFASPIFPTTVAASSVAGEAETIRNQQQRHFPGNPFV